MKIKFKMKCTALLLIVTTIFCSIFGTKIVLSKTKIYADENINPTLTIASNNLSYADSIYLLYAVSSDGFDGEKYPIKMLFWEEAQQEYVLGTETYVKNNEGTINLNGTGCYVFYSEGIAAKEMTKEIYSRACVQINGKIYYSEVTGFSVLEYVYTMRNKGNLTDEQDQLLTNMLNYGAAAQENFDFSPERLANREYYKISVSDGVLENGCSDGLYQIGESATLKAVYPSNDCKFLRWTDDEGNLIGETEEITIIVDEKSCFYQAIFQEVSKVTPDVPTTAERITNTIWREDASELSADVEELPPNEFNNISKFDWVKNSLGVLTNKTEFSAELMNKTADLSAYSDIYFSIKVTNGKIGVIGLEETEWYNGDDWLYFHYQQTDGGAWILSSLTSWDGYAKQSVQIITEENVKIKNDIPSIYGLLMKTENSGIYFIRESISMGTLVYMTNVLGVRATA